MLHYHGCRRGCQGRGVAVRNEVDTETLAKLIMERSPDLPTDLLIKKGSLIFLKLGTLKVHDK